MRKRLLVLLFCLAITPGLWAAEEFSIKSGVDKARLGIDEGLTFTVTLSGEAKEAPRVELPDLKDFEVLSSATSFDFATSGTEVKSARSIKLLLKPKRTGHLEIGPARVNYKGKEYKTEPIKIEVLRESPAPPPGSGSPPAKKEPKPEPLPESPFKKKEEIVL